MLNLEKRWQRLCNQIGVEDTGMLGVLIARYGESHRAYHNIRHIQSMLEEFDTVRCFTPNVSGVELAIWFHDVVYDTTRKNNEVQSADMFFNYARDILAPELIGAVTGMILATIHNRIPTATEAQILCDIDLSILGQPEKVFDEYEWQIRKEYDSIYLLIKMSIGRMGKLRIFVKNANM